MTIGASESGTERGRWGGRLGFILAAAGSAVGLGNIWKFPYITGENGGGTFVLFYLICIAAVGFPIMVAEVIVGRRAKASPVAAFAKLAGVESAWKLVGWMGVGAGFILLSYYSVVAGWALNYTLMAMLRVFESASPEQIGSLFGVLFASPGINLFWHAAFMLLTVLIVASGVRLGIERTARVLMPLLLLLLGVLLVYAIGLDGFDDGMAFVFGGEHPGTRETSTFGARGALEALGHSFFTLSIGMGAILTYGSYLDPNDDLVASSAMVSGLDTAVALMACMVIFPIVITFAGSDPALAGPGLVFTSMPLAFGQMPGGLVLGILFFLLLTFAALTSAISLLEVVVATVIDQVGWSRRRATLSMGLAIFLFGVPSAISGWSWFSESWASLFAGKNFFDTFDHLVSNWLLPLGGLLIAIFVGWVIPKQAVEDEFMRGSRLGWMFEVWYQGLRFVVPLAVTLVFAYSVGLIPEAWLG